MCGRYAIDLQPGLISEYYGVEIPARFSASYNVAPSQNVPVVCRKDDARSLAFMRWGLIPYWAKNPDKPMINARSETINSKPSFKNAFRQRRCILPASGFYEWRKIGNRKIPHYIHLSEESPMSFAGIWEQWRSPAGETIETCAILTTAANSVVAPIHDRMPVILSSDNFGYWLERGVKDPGKLMALLAPYPDKEIIAYPVSAVVNNPANNDPECIKNA